VIQLSNKEAGAQLLVIQLSITGTFQSRDRILNTSILHCLWASLPTTWEGCTAAQHIAQGSRTPVLTTPSFVTHSL
jgi:hypothetical protein